MATTTIQGTEREPRIALGVTLQRTRPGQASLADIAVVQDVVAALIGDDDSQSPTLDIAQLSGGGVIRTPRRPCAGYQ